MTLIDFILVSIPLIFIIICLIIAYYQIRRKDTNNSLFLLILLIFLLGSLVNFIFHFNQEKKIGQLNLWNLDFSINFSISSIYNWLFWYYCEKLRFQKISKLRLVFVSLLGALTIFSSIAYLFFELFDFWAITLIIQSFFGTVVFLINTWIYYKLYSEIDHTTFCKTQIIFMLLVSMGFILSFALFFNLFIFWIAIALYYIGILGFLISQSINISYPYQLEQKISSFQ